MSEAIRTRRDVPEIPYVTRQPFELSEELAARVDELGLRANIDQLRDEGYTIVPDIAGDEFTARHRETCIRLSQQTEGPARGRSAALLLGRDPIFEQVVLNPKIQTLVEVMCGQGTLAGGCTKVIPKSHAKRRHPNKEEIEQQIGAISTECAASSIVCWDGSTWHGNYPRQLDGDRVVLHITFSRLALRPVENYDHLDEKWLEGKPYALRVMLGREDFLGSTTIDRGGADYTRLPRTFTWAKT